MHPSSKGPLLVFFDRFVMLRESSGKLMRAVVLGHKVQRPRVRGIERRTNRLNARVRNRAPEAGRECGMCYRGSDS